MAQRRRNKFRASVKIDGVWYYLGDYLSKSAAVGAEDAFRGCTARENRSMAAKKAWERRRMNGTDRRVR